MPLLVALAAWAVAGFFIQVARQSVLQGHERQQARALQYEAQWRCKALPSRAALLRCQALLAERPPTDSASLQALVAEAAAAP